MNGRFITVVFKTVTPSGSSRIIVPIDTFHFIDTFSRGENWRQVSHKLQTKRGAQHRVGDERLGPTAAPGISFKNRGDLVFAVEETLAYYAFREEPGVRRPNLAQDGGGFALIPGRPIRAFAAARLRHIADTLSSTKHYLNIEQLKDRQMDQAQAGPQSQTAKAARPGRAKKCSRSPTSDRISHSCCGALWSVMAHRVISRRRSKRSLSGE